VSSRVQTAEQNARSGARHPGLTLNLSKRVAVGDPQAPLEHFLAILDGKGLLGDDGWISPRVHLVSMGDHFDWGGAKEWRKAADDGFALLSWLAAHPKAQVTLLLGNHDSARVGELARFDDARFGNARDAGAALYTGKKRDRADPAEQAFLQTFSELPSSELAARDFAAFEVRQRDLVTRLLRDGRFRLAAHVSGNVLLTHAGVSTRELKLLGLLDPDARAVAERLNAFLDEKVAAWREGPIDLTPLHMHGDSSGEGGGMLYHRASLRPDDASARRRRFPPSELPRSLTQVIGHVRDKKTRELLGLTAGGDRPGTLRSLTVTDHGVDYVHGVEKTAQMIFVDGGMKECPARDYQLLDLDTLTAI
jgi:hypothetical protein